MRFCRHVPNSIRSKNMKSQKLYLFKKLVFLLASKTLLSPLGTRKKNFSLNLEYYDFANGRDWVCKIWWTYRHRILLQDLMVRSIQFWTLHHALNRGYFEAFLMKNTLKTLGVHKSKSRKTWKMINLSFQFFLILDLLSTFRKLINK
jgi:hypothetical protein